MSNLDPDEKNTFDVENYNKEDLIGILNLTGDAPINENKINEKIQLLKYQLRNNSKKDKIFPFLEKASQKLIEQFNHFNEQTWEEAYQYDDSEATKVLTEQYQKKENEDKKNLILNWDSNIIGRVAQTKEDKMALQGTVQGNKNPIQRKTIKRIVNFDSHYRQILDPSAVNCSGITNPNPELAVANPQVRLYTSTNYTVNLNQPLLNVVDITVDNVEIPYSWYVFSEDYGTNRFQVYIPNITTDPIDVIIPDGNYSSASTLLSYISGVLSTTLTTANGPPLSNYISVPQTPTTSINNKTVITNIGNVPITVHWYIEDSKASACTAPFRASSNSLLEPPKPGNKINYNLGWLLGFRTQSITIGVSETITSPSTIDTYGPRYLLLTLDDFNNNKPNKDLISLIDNNTNNFKLPTYYKPQSMNPSIGVSDPSGVLYQPGYVGQDGFECVDVAGPPSGRGCAENDLNYDLISNLTKRQKYSVAQMIQANTTSNRKPRYSSPNSPDILLRIPVNNSPGNSNQIISFKNEKSEETKRVYFGPVKLRKFNIRLLNDKGFEVNLNDRDWSFSLIVNQLYQY